MARSIPTLSKPKVVKLYRQAIQAGVQLDTVDTKIESLLARHQVSQGIESSDQEQHQERVKRQLPNMMRWGAAVVPLAFIGIGLTLLGNAFLPIINYYIWELPQLRSHMLTTPIPPEQVLDVNPVIIAQVPVSDQVMAAETPSQPIILDTLLDYTNLSNWFSATTLPELQLGGGVGAGETYVLDIPSLKVTNAEVTIGGTNLSKSLIQYPGTASPGELGAPVIFGHSVLRQFYNPSEKNSRRYTSIFSYIMTLKKGDLIYATHKSIKYTYRVEDKTEVKPEDVYILTQKYDARKLKLVTCTPEGTYLRRGVVTAVLVPN